MGKKAPKSKIGGQELILQPCNSNAASFFNCEELSDCEIVTDKDGRIRPCHKVVLCSGSDCFKAMFVRCDMLEANSGKVVIKDADPAIVDKLLSHMYGMEVKVHVLQVPAMYQLADQYQVKSAQNGLINAVQKASFSLNDITALVPKAAALGDTANALRALLARQAAQHISAIVQHPQSVKQWGLLEVQDVMRHRAVSSLQALVLAAVWTAGCPVRLSRWPALQQEVKLEKLRFAELCSLKGRQEVLEVPGLAAALFEECLRRMTSTAGHAPTCQMGYTV